MFKFDLEQKVFNIGGINVGGQLGENPPLLIGNMFQRGDPILDERREGKFDRKMAEERIHELELISKETGIPCMIAMVANSEEEIKTYIDFFISITEMPFAIDIWKRETRLAAARYISKLGLQDRALYNSITPWDDDIDAQVLELKDLGIKHVVLQVFDMEDKTHNGRVKSLNSLLPIVERGNFKSILVDTAAMNLPATVFSLIANYLIKKEFGLPVGLAPSNGTYMWRKRARDIDKNKFQAIDAGVHAISALFSDFLLFGPLSGMRRVFSAVAVACGMLGALAYQERNFLPEGSHPLNILFPDVVEQFRKERK